MLIELWEKSRGYDKWIETVATIESSQLAEVEVGPSSLSDKKQAWKEWRSFCSISWVDSDGVPHGSKFEVTEGSPLFQLYDGQSIGIRYNPTAPGQFYLPGVLKSKIFSAIKWSVLTIILAVITLFILWIH